MSCTKAASSLSVEGNNDGDDCGGCGDGDGGDKNSKGGGDGGNDDGDNNHHYDNNEEEEEDEDDEDEDVEVAIVDTEADDDDNDRKPAAAAAAAPAKGSTAASSKDGGTSKNYEPPKKKRKRRRVISTLQESKWQQMFQRLVAYKNRHGNALVPNRYAQDASLGAWVATQRRNYRVFMSGTDEPSGMTTERVQALEAIGFQWSTTDPRHEPWEVRYEELKAFVRKYGHAEIPMRWEENVQLSNWVSKQRQDYKLRLKHKSTRLTDERMKLLNDLGFKWQIPRKGRKIKLKSIPVKNSALLENLEPDDSEEHDEEEEEEEVEGPPALNSGTAMSGPTVAGAGGTVLQLVEQQTLSPSPLPASFQSTGSKNGSELTQAPAGDLQPQQLDAQDSVNPAVGTGININLAIQNAIAALTSTPVPASSGVAPTNSTAPVNVVGQARSALDPPVSAANQTVAAAPVQAALLLPITIASNFLNPASSQQQHAAMPYQANPAGLQGLVLGGFPSVAAPTPALPTSGAHALASQLLTSLGALTGAPLPVQTQPQTQTLQQLASNALPANQLFATSLPQAQQQGMTNPFSANQPRGAPLTPQPQQQLPVNPLSVNQRGAGPVGPQQQQSLAQNNLLATQPMALVAPQAQQPHTSNAWSASQPMATVASQQQQQQQQSLVNISAVNQPAPPGAPLRGSFQQQLQSHPQQQALNSIASNPNQFLESLAALLAGGVRNLNQAQGQPSQQIQNSSTADPPSGPHPPPPPPPPNHGM